MLKTFFHLPFSKAGLWVLIVTALVIYTNSMTAITTAQPLLPVSHPAQADRPAPAAPNSAPNHLVYLPLVTTTTTSTASAAIYWGAWISDNVTSAPYGYISESDPGILGTFEARTGKKVSIIHLGQAWQDSTGTYNSFSNVAPARTGAAPISGVLDMIRAHGAIPLLDWGSWKSGSTSLNTFPLSAMSSGAYDVYLSAWAQQAAQWGHPFFLRFDWEANGDWFPWGTKGGKNSNTPAAFIAAWRHVHDVFVQNGATNVTWVWNMNTEYTGSTPVAQLYPGNAYVDWTSMDGYNWSSDKSEPWLSFTTVFSPTYNTITALAPGKPVMIAETGTSKNRPANDTDMTHTKSAWITDALSTKVLATFPRIKAMVWFNWDAKDTTLDWPIEGNSFDLKAGAPPDQTSIRAFHLAIVDPIYTTNTFGAYSRSPIIAP